MEENIVSIEDKLTIEDKVTIKELEEKIEKMKADKEAKCKSAKEQLISMLEVTVDKYLTATGTAEALRVLQFVTDGNATVYEANLLANQMAVQASEMTIKAKNLNYAVMDKLCDGFYEKNFRIADTDTNAKAANALAYEMMRIDLCRNVGGAAEDMVSFIKRVEDEIDATGKKLKELRAKESK